MPRCVKRLTGCGVSPRGGGSLPPRRFHRNTRKPKQKRTRTKQFEGSASDQQTFRGIPGTRASETPIHHQRERSRRRNEMRKILRFLTAPAVSMALASTGNAAVYIPTKTTDSAGACTPHNCSLREAILAANHNPGDD